MDLGASDSPLGLALCHNTVWAVQGGPNVGGIFLTTLKILLKVSAKMRQKPKGNPPGVYYFLKLFNVHKRYD